MKRDLVAVCAALGAALPLSMLAAGAGPFTVRVSPAGPALEAALAQTRASSAPEKEIVLADGDYFLGRTIVLGRPTRT